MRKLLCFLLLLLFFPLLVPAQTGTLPLPRLWLRGDTGTSVNGLWMDQSGHDQHAVAAEGEAPQADGLLNFNSVLRYDGSDDYMQIPYSLEGLSEITVFAVYQSADTVERGIWGTEKGNSRRILFSTRRVSGPDEAVDGYGKNEKMAILSTLVQQWNETSSISAEAYLSLGTSGKEQDTIKVFKGLLAELMIFDKSLSFLERVQIQTYLALKYGIPLKEGNYVSAAEQVLWKAEENQEYAWRLAGIGRAAAFSLHQKQSVSAYDTTRFLLLSAGPPAATNLENKATIPDEHFLLWGDNNLALSDTLKKEQEQDTLLAVLERKWLMTASGSEINQLATELRFTTASLPNDSSAYWLLIDPTGRGDYSLDNVNIVLADTVLEDSISVYRGVRWDSDRSGKDGFSLARAKYMVAQVHSLQHPDCEKPAGGRAAFRVTGGKAPYRYSLRKEGSDALREWKGPREFSQDSLEAGVYHLRITDAENYKTERQFSLQLPNTLVVDLGEDRPLPAGSKLLLNAGEFVPDTIPATYLWESSYGFRSTDPRISIGETGIYTVTVSNAEGCSFTDEIVISGAVARRFAVFPSPVSSGKQFKVSVSLKEAGPVSLRVYSLSGNLLHHQKGEHSAEYQFNMALKDPGMYNIMLDTPEGTEVKRIVVQ
ncbi:T9SS type A sorting domain-containing protein [Nafulsella turpanensis]|uniref:T9SS type A sorting domain-containing protein n=1 Tax=Nafulsella turpanensis TaxID=1265690 RepID=UPI0003821AE7|nr:T9SS type A sorting domain-containing protein [Nafulsella turpanensis]